MTGLPGFGSRVLVGAVLVKAVYALPTWTRTARLIAEYAALREVIGGAPSQWALYRFTAKLREHSAVERKFGNLKLEWGLLPLRVCRLAGYNYTWI